MLETAKKTLTLSSQSPRRLHKLLLNAFGTSHTHLRPLYALRILNDGVKAEYKNIQINLAIDNVKEFGNILDIGDDILKENYPIKYLNVSLSSDELSALNSLASHKDLAILYNHPILEIVYDTGKS